MTSALTGYTVVDLTTGPAGAQCTQFLGDHGARVIRVIDGDDEAFRPGGFVIWDRGKECVRLDLSEVEIGGEGPASEAYTRLLQCADVVVEDCPPSAREQRLLAYPRLRAVNPRLVACSITAYGKEGPWKDEPAQDDLVLARMGILGSMPGFRPAPVHVVHPLPSVGACVLATLGIVGALYARETTGRGREVATTLMAGALLYHPKVTGEKLEPHTFQTHPSGSAPFYSNYECADGNWVQLGCVHAGFIGIAGRVLGITETLAEPRFGEGRAPVDDAADAALRGILTDIIRTKPYAVWALEFEEADVPYAPARWTAESMGDPQVQHNEMVLELDDPVFGTVAQTGIGLKLEETPGALRGPRQDALPLNELPAGLQGGSSQPVEMLGDLLAPEAPPLDGVRILEITNLIAGPTGGRLLADLGADVIKFEPLTGDMSRPIGRTYFYSVNFNKRSVSVDTRTDEGKAIVQRIAGSADVLLANLRPHATERMGIGPAINPQLIEIHLTGYGFTGPYAKRPGIDPLAQAYMGLQRAQGGTENPPVFPAQLAPTDFTTGAVGAIGAVMCLLARSRSGVVQRGESNLLNGGILLCSEWFCRYEGQPERPLADGEQLGLSPYHRLFEVKDGWVYVAAETAAQRRALEALLGASDTTPLGEAHPNAGPRASAFATAVSGMTVEEALAALGRANVPAAPALSGDSEIFLASAHAQANNIIANREHPNAGALRVAWNYVSFGETRSSEGRPTPLLGEHTRAVLSEIGYSAQEIERLHEAGIVKTEHPMSS